MSYRLAGQSADVRLHAGHGPVQVSASWTADDGTLASCVRTVEANEVARYPVTLYPRVLTPGKGWADVLDAPPALIVIEIVMPGADADPV